MTNASRTLLMNLETLDWDPEILAALDIPAAMLPEIRSSAEVYGTVRDGPLAGVPVASRARATSRPRCSARPASRRARPSARTAPAVSCCSTPAPSRSSRSTACSPRSATGSATRPAVYALEGAIAVTGSLIQWLRDNLGLIRSAAEVEELARSVPRQRRLLPGTGVLRTVRPALALGRPRRAGRPDRLSSTGAMWPGPRWRRARWQTREVVDAMNADGGTPLASSRWTAA